jgi:hypothetical protein
MTAHITAQCDFFPALANPGGWPGTWPLAEYLETDQGKNISGFYFMGFGQLRVSDFLPQEVVVTVVASASIAKSIQTYNHVTTRFKLPDTT